MGCDGDHGAHVLGLVKRLGQSMAGTMYLRNCPRFLVRASVVSELLVLILFLVGPSGASVDSDGDGIPDIPIVVSASSPISEISKTRGISLCSVFAQPAAAVRRVKMPSDPSNTHVFQPHRVSFHLGLQFLCLLRC